MWAAHNVGLWAISVDADQGGIFVGDRDYSESRSAGPVDKCTLPGYDRPKTRGEVVRREATAGEGLGRSWGLDRPHDSEAGPDSSGMGIVLGRNQKVNPSSRMVDHGMPSWSTQLASTSRLHIE